MEDVLPWKTDQERVEASRGGEEAKHGLIPGEVPMSA